MNQNYKEIILMISVLMISMMGYSQNILISIVNAQNTNDGSNDYFEADIMIQTVDGLADFKLGSGQLYFNYNSAAFGEDVYANTRIEVTADYGSGYFLGEMDGFTDFYDISTINDNTTSRVAWAFSQGVSSGAMTEMVGSTAKKMVHIKFTYVDVNEAPMVALENLLTGSNDQFYTACGPSGTATTTLDCITEPAMQFHDAALVSTSWTGNSNTNWDDAANWSNGLPTAGSSATIPNITNDPVASGAIDVFNLFIESGAALTVTGAVNNTEEIVVNSGASLIAQSTVSGAVTYNLNITDTNWHLVSSPVEGEQYDATWIIDNLIDDTTGAGTNVGIGTYTNTPDANGDWTYVTDGGSGSLNNGQGYAILRDDTGTDLSFTGTLKTDNLLNTINIANSGTADENRWNLVGNPYPSYLLVSDLITANSANLTDTHEMVYVWNGTSYIALTGTDYIHPGQGFFVNADNSVDDNFTITESLQSHQTGPFYRLSSDPSITLMITNDTETKSTEINYLADKTTGLDPSFDVGTFTGQPTAFSMYSHLVANSEGVDFMRQALPQDYENLIVPIGINASSGTTLTFTANVQNLPQDLDVYLEDSQSNTFTQLNAANGEYSLTLDNDMGGIGRFYLRTTSQTLGVNIINLDNISLYTTADNSLLNIEGLNDGQANVLLFDLTGKRILDSRFQSNRFNTVALPSLNAGIYIVKLQSESGSLNKKIIID